jgi:hypothetical protein
VATLEQLTLEQRQAIALGNLARHVVHGGDAGASEQMKRLLGKADPKLKFPELDIQDSIRKLKDEQGEQNKKLEQELKRLRAERVQEKLHAKVRDAGLKEEDVVKFLEHQGMPSTDSNYDLAIEVLTHRAELAEPASSGASENPFKPPDIKEVWADPVGWREREAHKVLAEMRGVRIV